MKECVRCIFNERLPNIYFDEKGVCSYCEQHNQLEKAYPIGKEGYKRLKALAAEIKRSGKNKKYDCVIGVSGGCDSSYLLHLAKELGLRPLAVHFDNTWNSKIAVENIHKVLEKLHIDLYTNVIDNEEFCDIAQAYLHASVPEIDATTDIALITTLYMAADKHGIKYILDGHSFRTEGVSPIGWFYFDGKYVADVHRRFGKLPMKTYPNLWFGRWMKWVFKGIKRVRPLYYIDYNKDDAKKMLNSVYGWNWYGGHHLENRYTAFNHYLLATKFQRDMRIVERSALVRSGQISREQALSDVSKKVAEPKDIIEEIKKRLKLSDEDYERILKLKPKTYKDYNTYRELFIRLRPFFWVLMKFSFVPDSFYMKYCFK